MIGAIIFLTITTVIVAIHIWLCKQIVWARYDIISELLNLDISGCIEYDHKIYCRGDLRNTPTNNDLLKELYSRGGPLIIIPVFNLAVLFLVTIDYFVLKSELSEFEEKRHPENTGTINILNDEHSTINNTGVPYTICNSDQLHMFGCNMGYQKYIQGDRIIDDSTSNRERVYRALLGANLLVILCIFFGMLALFGGLIIVFAQY